MTFLAIKQKYGWWPTIGANPIRKKTIFTVKLESKYFNYSHKTDNGYAK